MNTLERGPPLFLNKEGMDGIVIKEADRSDLKHGRTLVLVGIAFPLKNCLNPYDILNKVRFTSVTYHKSYLRYHCSL